MTQTRIRLAAVLTAGTLLVTLQACTTVAEDSAAATAAAPAAPAQPAGPALWQVADEDTTIYLFGTVHALPEDIDWYSGPVATALGSSGTLVTEIPSGFEQDPANQQKIIGMAMLPEGESLRELLDPEQRASYEAAMTSLDLPVGAFDRFEPWFAGMNLAVLPLLKAGYAAESGVEKVVEQRAPEGATRDALETVEFQLGMLDTLPPQSQVDFLTATTDMIDEIVPMMNQMLSEWVEGDAEALGALMNANLADPVLAEALLYGRNRTWAAWIDERLDTPGTVFVAVGAGHLAGTHSVQDYLEQRGTTVTRIQ
ncbi:MAG: TraB/GumN family protein [Alphaproteobacteria bacterium]|nr:TraB/GumN family protein [Alphaproteobacteria bacterium]